MQGGLRKQSWTEEKWAVMGPDQASGNPMGSSWAGYDISGLCWAEMLGPLCSPPSHWRQLPWEEHDCIEVAPCSRGSLWRVWQLEALLTSPPAAGRVLPWREMSVGYVHVSQNTPALDSPKVDGLPHLVSTILSPSSPSHTHNTYIFYFR